MNDILNHDAFIVDGKIISINLAMLCAKHYNLQNAIFDY